MKKLRSLSIFFPSYNDSKTLPKLLARTCSVAPKLANSFEVIIINDGSTDDTVEVLKTLKKQYPNLRIINHKKNLGYGAALRSGFTNAEKDWVFYTDGDGQYDPAELVVLVDKLEESVDVVNGFKITRSDPIIRKIVGALWNWLLHRMYPLPIRDVDCDFRLIRRSLLSKINLSSTSGIVCLELVLKLKKAGAIFKEVGVHHYKRPFGSSKFFTFKNIVKTVYDNIVFYFSDRK